MSKKKPDTSKYYFDNDAAMNVVHFFERELKHIKGKWAGQNLILEPWQKAFLMEIFGWKRKDNNKRKYRVVYLEVPRKNGKSFIASGLGLYLTLADEEGGAEVVSAAVDREQARIVFDTAKQMVAMNPRLRKHAEAYQRAIIVKETASVYKVISADAFSKHGLNLHGVIVDEVHAQKNRELIDVLKTSTGAREQPLEVYITTAGYDKNSICYELHSYSKRLLDPKDSLEDPEFFPLIFAADEKDDWTKESTWKKANPNYGVSLNEDYFVSECKRAQELPSYENTFKRLHLNIWTEQETRLIPMDKWRAVSEIAVKEEHLIGEECYCGLDLSTTTDITAFIMCFPNAEKNKMMVISKFWIPRERMIERIRRDKMPYDVWEKQGLITVTEGERVDYSIIRKEINELGDKFAMKDIAFDPWNATQLALQLEEDGFEMVQCRQTASNLSYPTKELLAWVCEEAVLHGGNPILDRMASVVVGLEDSSGNIRPNKKKSAERIDGIVGLIMGLWRILVTQNEPDLVYKERGLIKL